MEIPVTSSPRLASAPSDPRSAPFGYECRRCLRCCRDKIIRLNPYEVARLARHRGQTTTALRDASTEDGAGLALARTSDGACVFLGPDGCTVHSDRPLVCRLYPLGRFRSFTGAESYRTLEPHPQSEGEWHERSDIAAYLAAQEAEPFIRAADAYLDWIGRALTGLSDGQDRTPQDLLDQAMAGEDLLDMDAAIARHAAATGLAPPTDIEARTALHLALLDDQLDSLGDDRHAS